MRSGTIFIATVTVRTGSQEKGRKAPNVTARHCLGESAVCVCPKWARGTCNYPAARETADEDPLRVLHAVNLGSLARRVGGSDVEKDWPHFLRPASSSDLRLRDCCCGRRALRFWTRRPARSTPVNEMLLYSQLAKTSILYASNGHRPSIDQYHDQVLKLRGNGEWETTRVEQSRTASVASEVASIRPWSSL